MTIIIEGPDCVGKTTAVKRICDLMEWDYYHVSRPESTRHALRLYSMPLLKTNTVFDRCHLGSLVYGRELGFGPPVKYKDLRAFSRLYRSAGVLVVVMYDGTGDVIRENFDKKPSMFPLATVLEANEAFKQNSHHMYGWCDLAWNVDNFLYPKDEDLKRWIEYARAV